MKCRSVFALCLVGMVLVLAMKTAVASHVVSYESSLTDQCRITFASSISDSRYYAYARTTTTNSSATTSVSGTFYYLNIDTGVTASMGNGSGGNGNCGVEFTLSNVKCCFYKIISSHSVTYDGGVSSRRNMVNEVRP